MFKPNKIVLAIAFGLMIVASSVLAGTYDWTAPKSTPGTCDPAIDGMGCYPPINVGSVTQTRSGILQLTKALLVSSHLPNAIVSERLDATGGNYIKYKNPLGEVFAGMTAFANYAIGPNNTGSGLAPSGAWLTISSSTGNMGVGTSNTSYFKVRSKGHVGPDADMTYDLGSSALAWRNLYGVNICDETGACLDISNLGGGESLWKLSPRQGDNSPINIYYTDGSVGIGTNAPTSQLDLTGQIKIRGGNPAAGKVLTSDAYGLASWTTPTPGGNVNGTGEAGRIPKWVAPSQLGLSLLYDNGAGVGLGTNNPTRELHIKSDSGAQIRLAGTGNTAWDGIEWGTPSFNGYSGMNENKGYFFVDMGSNGEDLTILQNGKVALSSSHTASISDDNDVVTLKYLKDNYSGTTVPGQTELGPFMYRCVYQVSSVDVNNPDGNIFTSDSYKSTRFDLKSGPSSYCSPVSTFYTHTEGSTWSFFTQPNGGSAIKGWSGVRTFNRGTDEANLQCYVASDLSAVYVPISGGVDAKTAQRIEQNGVDLNQPANIWTINTQDLMNEIDFTCVNEKFLIR